MEVNKTHRFCRTPYGFQMSPYLQGLSVFSGQHCVFEDASEQLFQLAGVEVTSKQVERLTHAYGQLLEADENEDSLPGDQKEGLHYCMADGGMVFTREDGWKEMKLARLFPAKALMSENGQRNFIKESTYVAHLGGHTPFCRKLETHTDGLKQMVWICDGAAWLWKWIGSSYPDSVQILDYYHCSEKLHGFAREAIKDDGQRHQWIDEQESLLLDGQVDQVINHIDAMSCKGKAQQCQRTLLTYYENNRQRMDYKAYREQGLLIGSGPMEAAHRHVVQCRLKLSGQRWTIKGAQQVVNLRVANKSGQWEKVLNLIKLN